MRRTAKATWVALMFAVTTMTGPSEGLDRPMPRSSHRSPEVVAARSLELRAHEGRMYHRGLPFTGVAVEHYTDGRLRRRIAYQAGKKHGLSEQWFESGQVSYVSHHRRGRQHGEARTWWRNGNLRSVSRFEHGVAHGLQEQWYVSGAKFKQIRLERGREEGLQQSWRVNGSLYNNYETRDGRVFGLKRSKLCYRVDEQEVKINR